MSPRLSRVRALRGLRCLAVFCLLPLAAQALEFRVLSWSGTVGNLHLATGAGGKPIPLSAGEDALSPVYRTQGDAPLRLYRTPAEGEIAPETEPIAVLPLPVGLERAILVLAPGSREGGGYAGLWLDDSEESRPDNSISLHNLSAMPVALSIGSEQVELAPRGNHCHRFSDTERLVPIQAAVPRGERWERVINDAQPVRRGFRILVIMREGRRQPDGNIDVLDRVTLYDYRKPPAAAR